MSYKLDDLTCYHVCLCVKRSAAACQGFRVRLRTWERPHLCVQLAPQGGHADVRRIQLPRRDLPLHRHHGLPHLLCRPAGSEWCMRCESRAHSRVCRRAHTGLQRAAGPCRTAWRGFRARVGEADVEHAAPLVRRRRHAPPRGGGHLGRQPPQIAQHLHPHTVPLYHPPLLHTEMVPTSHPRQRCAPCLLQRLTSDVFHVLRPSAPRRSNAPVSDAMPFSHIFTGVFSSWHNK